MILFATLSKPVKNIETFLDRPYIKVRFWKSPSFSDKYEAEFFTEKQSFRKSFSKEEAESFIETNGGKVFRNVVERTESEEITLLANRHGQVKKIVRPLKNQEEKNSLVAFKNIKNSNGDRAKKYILQEGQPLLFLEKLGIMTKEGKIHAAKYDKWRQINRFLEYIADVLPQLQELTVGEKGFSQDRPLRIADFGCGKSYLTFALYHFLYNIKNIPVQITGLDLKADVIADCQALAEESAYRGLAFFVGDIAHFTYSQKPDMIITLHACDTATDYALNFAVKEGASLILSVPCCQHEINSQLQQIKGKDASSPFASLQRWGIVRERFAALATDVIRAEVLEEEGYSVQLLEFIDMSHTPKNILIRAVKRKCNQVLSKADLEKSVKRKNALLEGLSVSQSLNNLLQS